MYLIEKLKMFFGRLLCEDDHSEFKVVSECSFMLRKKDPCEKRWSLSRGGSRKNSDILMTTPIVPRPKIYDYIYTYKHTNTKET